MELSSGTQTFLSLSEYFHHIPEIVNFHDPPFIIMIAFQILQGVLFIIYHSNFFLFVVILHST